jgi:hypothetical protein
LEQLGVAIQDSSGAFTTAGDRLRQYAQIRQSLSEGDRAYYDRIISGTQQINILTAALNDLGKANGIAARAQKISSGATNEAILQNEELNKTLKSLLSQTSTNLTELFSSIGGELGNTLSSSLSIVNDLLKSLSESEGFIKGFSNILSGPGITSALVLLGKTFLFVSKDIAKAISAFAGLNTKALEQAKIEEKIRELKAGATNEELKQLNNANSLVARREALLAIEQRITAEKRQQEILDSSVSDSFLTGGRVLGGKRLPRGLTGGLFSDKGFVSNFADPLSSAIARERASGVSANQIYIDTDSRLKGPGNPLGLMVANKRDEPLGGFQGVNRAIKEGANPKTYGTVPNFATFDRVKDSSLGDLLNIRLSPSEIDFVNKQIIDYGAALLENNKVLRKEIRSSVKKLNLNKESELLIKLALQEEERAFSLIKRENSNREKQLKKAEKDPPSFFGPFSPSTIIRNPPRANGVDFESTRQQFSGQSPLASDILGMPAGMFTSPAQQESIKRSELRRITENIRLSRRISGGDIDSLGGEDFRRLQDQAKKEAIKNLGLQEVSNSILEKDREAQRLILSERNKILNSLRQFGTINKESIERQKQAQRVGLIEKQLGGLGFLGSIGLGGSSRDLKRIGNIDPRDREIVGGLLQQRQDRRAARLNNLSLGAAFAAPFAAGFIPEGAGGTGKGQLLGGASGALQGAGFGGIFGPIGIAIGAAGGGLIGALNKLEKSASEVALEFGVLSDAQAKSIEVLGGILNIQEQLKTAPDAKRGSLITNQFSLLSELDADSRKKIISSGFNQNTILAEQEKAATRKQLLDRIGAASANATGISGGPFKTFAKPFTFDAAESDQLAKQLATIIPESVFQKVIGNKDLFSSAFQDRSFSRGLGVNTQQLNSVQGFFNEIAKTTNTEAIKVTTANFKELAQSLLNGSVQAKKLADDLKQAEKIQKAFGSSIKGLKNFGDVSFSGESAFSGFGSLVAQDRLKSTSSSKLAKNQGFLASVSRLEELGVDTTNLNNLSEKAKIDVSSQGLLSLAQDFLLGRRGVDGAQFKATDFKDLNGNPSRNKIIDALSNSRGAVDSQESALARVLLDQFTKETFARQIPLSKLNLESPERITGIKPKNLLEKGPRLSQESIVDIPSQNSEYLQVLKESKEVISGYGNSVQEFNKLLQTITSSTLKVDEQRKLILDIRGDSSLVGELNTNDPQRFLNELYLTINEYAKRLSVLEAKSGTPPPPKVRGSILSELSNQNISRATQ